MNKPAWNEDGNPANLEAAAMDAVEWLEVYRVRMPRNIPDYEENKKRLEDCIAELEKQLGEEIQTNE